MAQNLSDIVIEIRAKDNASTVIDKVNANVGKLTVSQNQGTKSTQKFAKSQTKLNKSFSSFNLAKLFSMIYMVRRLKNVLQDAIEISASWVENLNLLEVTYKETTDSALGLVKSMSTKFGLDPNDIVQYSATFMQMANAMGQARDTAYTMSTALTQIALDLASLRNVTFGQAVSDFESAIAGQVKPVRKYGMDITSFSIDDLLKRQGIAGSSTRMTMLDKQLARTILLIEQSRDAWGDYAKTINTFANQQKVLVAQYKQLLRALGDVFVGTVNANASFEEAMQTAGIATKAIWYLNGALMALTSIIRVFKPENMVSGFNQTTSAIKQYNEELENAEKTTNGMLLSFDKFEALDSGNGMAENMTAILESILQSEYAEYLAVAEERMANMVSYATDIRDRILEWVFPDFDSASESFQDFMNKIRFPNWNKEVETLEEYIERTGDTGNSIFGEMNNKIKLVTASLSILLGVMAVAKLKTFFSGLSLGLMEVATTTKLVTTNTTLLGKAFSFILNHPIILAIGVLIGLLIYLYKENDRFAESVNRLFSALKTLFNKALEPLSKLLDALSPLLGFIIDILAEFLIAVVDIITWVIELINKFEYLGDVLLWFINPLMLIAKYWDNISSAVQKAFGWISKVVDKMKEFLSSGKGKVADFFEKFFGGGFGNPVPIPQFASGGFPDSGQIFMARENGISEMVGSFGGRSAVANNDQIVSGIQQGVYNAVMSALQQNSGMFESGGGDVYIDRSKVGRVVAKSVFDEGRRAGYIKV